MAHTVVPASRHTFPTIDIGGDIPRSWTAVRRIVRTTLAGLVLGMVVVGCGDGEPAPKKVDAMVAPVVSTVCAVPRNCFSP